MRVSVKKLKSTMATLTLLLIVLGLGFTFQGCARTSNIGQFGYYMEYEEDTPEMCQKIQELKDVMRRENQACTNPPGEVI